jgi:hypothetical protein
VLLMRHLTLLFGALAASCCVAPLLADTTSLQSILINANGTTYANTLVTTLRLPSDTFWDCFGLFRLI